MDNLQQEVKCPTERAEFQLEKINSRTENGADTILGHSS